MEMARMNKINFKITETEAGNYLVILYKNGKEVDRNCVGKHSSAVSWGARKKKQMQKFVREINDR